MKKYISIIFCWLFIWCIPNINAQQASEENDLSEIISKVALPRLTYLQRVKGLTFISPNESSKRLTRVLKNGKTSLAFTNPPESGYDLNQIWWVVQDFAHRGFSLVSAVSKDASNNTKDKRWLFLDKDGQLNLDVQEDIEEFTGGGYDYTSKKYFFEFISLSGISDDGDNKKKPNQVSIRAITHSLIKSEIHTDTDNTLLIHDSDTLASKKITAITDFKKADDTTQNKFLFTYKKINFNVGDNYIPLPISNSEHHHTRTGSVNFNYVTVKKKDQNNRPVVLLGNQKYLVSGLMTSFNSSSNGALDDKMFKVHFVNTPEKTVAEIGILGSEYVQYSREVIQQEGLRKPMVGLRKKLNKLYAFTTNTRDYGEELEGFNIDEPLYFGFINGIGGGVFVVSQGAVKREFTGIPTDYIFGFENPKPARLLVGVEQGKVGLAYRGEAIGVSTTDFGDAALKVPEFHNTDPYFSFNPPTKKAQAETSSDVVIYNEPFDWMQKTYKLRYSTANGIVTKKVYSPFFNTDEDFDAISAKEKEVPSSIPDVTKAIYSGGEDFYHNTGWELIAVDFGYDENQLPKEEVDVRAAPYMILYNRTLGRLRLFVYATNFATSNRLKASLKVTNVIGGASKIKPLLWSTYLQGKALDDLSISNAAYAQGVKLSGLNGGDGKFVYFDYQLNSDPCSCISKYELQIHIDKISQGKIELAGRSMGRVIPASQLEEYGMENPADFLTSVLESPYADTRNTLGDMTVRNYNKFRSQTWPRVVKGVLQGRKIEQWEKEEARLKYEGTLQMAKGDETSAKGKIVKAAGEALAGAGSTGSAAVGANPYAASAIAAGTVLKVVGEGLDAYGTRVKGWGRKKVGEALKLRYKAIKNKDRTADQNLSFTLPKPQPSIVFSELAAKGTLSITTQAANTIRIAIPGSTLATTAKFKPSANRGVKPVYNEPLGIFSMLHKPKLAINFENIDDVNEVTASVSFKEWPYITTNFSKTRNLGVGLFRLHTALKVYSLAKDSINSGLSIGEVYDSGEEALLMSKNVGLKDIPLNIQGFLREYQSEKYSKQYILDRIKQGFFTVSVKVIHAGVGQKNLTDTNDISKTSQSFESNINYVYEQGTLVANTKENNADVFYDGTNKNDEEFDDISPALLENWSTEKIGFVSEDLPNYKSKVLAYCQNRNKNTLVASRKASTDKKDTTIGKKSVQPSNNNNVIDAVVPNDVLIEDLDVFPNPSSQVFNVRYIAKSHGKITLQVIDMVGNVLLKHIDTAIKEGEEKRATINLQSLTGVYVLKIQFANGESLETKLIKK